MANRMFKGIALMGALFALNGFADECKGVALYSDGSDNGQMLETGRTFPEPPEWKTNWGYMDGMEPPYIRLSGMKNVRGDWMGLLSFPMLPLRVDGGNVRLKVRATHNVKFGVWLKGDFGISSVHYVDLPANTTRTLEVPLSSFGVAGGVSQYAAIWLLRCAMKRGPLAPAWCAMSLGGFVPVIIFSLLFLGEIPTLWQGLSLVCALGAIAAAAANQNGTREGGTTTFAGMAGYAVLLVLLLIFTGVLNVLLKAVADLPGTVAGQSLLRSQGNVLMCFVYVGMAVSSAAELTVARKWVVNRYALIGGAMLCFGALSAYAIILSIMTLPAVKIFVLSNITSILVVALGTVSIFHEKPNRAWCLVVLFSLLAVLLNR